MSESEKDRQFREEALRWLPEVTRFAISLTRNEVDAEDLVQETFLRAYRSWHLYEPGTECRGWLFTICRNHFLRLRERDRRQVICDDPELESLAAARFHNTVQQSGYHEMFSQVDLAEAVDRALAELPEGYREVVILVDIEDQSYQTASDVLGLPIGTVRSRLFRGRRLLQEKLLVFARDAGLLRSAGSSKVEYGS